MLEEGAILGVVRPIEKHCTQQTINNGISAIAAAD